MRFKNILFHAVIYGVLYQRIIFFFFFHGLNLFGVDMNLREKNIPQQNMFFVLLFLTQVCKIRLNTITVFVDPCFMFFFFFKL